jgi:hypothetical protein
LGAGQVLIDQDGRNKNAVPLTRWQIKGFRVELLALDDFLRGERQARKTHQSTHLTFLTPTFYAWASRKFGFSQRQTKRYEDSAKLVAPQKRPASDTLSDALRSVGKSPRGHHGLGARNWIKPIDDIADRARRDAEF